MTVWFSSSRRLIFVAPLNRASRAASFSFMPDLLEARVLWSTTGIVPSAPYTIEGVQPAALDQPQIHALLERPGDTQPISADDGFGGTTFDIQAFLDTGTSGFILSQETAQGLGINSQVVNGQNATYSDYGVAGSEDFDISEPLNISLAPFSPTADVDNPADFQTVYNQSVGPVRTEINRLPADDLVGPIDIIGMPAMQNKVVVMDPKPVDTGLANMNTYIYNPGTPFNPATADTDPGIPQTNLQVKLSYGSFDRFTQTSPGAQPPTLAMNPFIGPNPVNQLLKNPPPDNTPPITISMGSASTTGSFLFDTGSAASFISTAMAAKVGVSYEDGTYNSDNPVLVDSTGTAVPNQFVLPISGIDGSQINVAGFFLDSMTLQTTSGVPLEFIGAPVLVADISVTDPVTNQTLTLDGDFGMNYLVASTNISNGNFGDTSGGAFDWETFDQAKGLLGLQLDEMVPMFKQSVSTVGRSIPKFIWASQVGLPDSSPQLTDVSLGSGTDPFNNHHHTGSGIPTRPPHLITPITHPSPPPPAVHSTLTSPRRRDLLEP